MRVLRVLALDLSLTATGWATSEMQPLTGRVCGVLETAKLRGVERLAHVRQWLQRRIEKERFDVAVLEGYAYGMRRGASQQHSLGELGGVVRLTLWYQNVPFVEVPPAVLKKFACGKGNANKAEVLVAAVKRLEYTGADHNEADALWLRTMALDHYDELVEPVVPKAHREVLAKVKWPELERRAVA